MRLIALEVKGAKKSSKISGAAFLACAKLREPLIRLMGRNGFRALLSRALALSTSEIPWLRSVQINADGSLEDPSELESKIAPKDWANGSVTLVAQLLGLLVTFLGERLASSLLREAWPGVALGNLNSEAKENPGAVEQTRLRNFSGEVR